MNPLIVGMLFLGSKGAYRGPPRVSVKPPLRPAPARPGLIARLRPPEIPTELRYGPSIYMPPPGLPPPRPPTAPAGPRLQREYPSAVAFAKEAARTHMTYEKAVAKAYTGTRQEFLPI